MNKKYFEDVIYQFKRNRLKEIFIKKNYVEFYNYINSNFTANSFLEKLYIFYIGDKLCICGQRTKFISFTKGYSKHCSYKCASNSEEVRNKYKKSCSEKYGYDNPSKSNVIKKKKEQTFSEKYGVKCYLQTNNVKKIIKDKYNVDNVFESEIIKEKIKKTNIEKYGVEVSILNEKIREKSIGKIKEKYGFDSFSKTDEFKKIMIDYNYNRYMKDIKIDGYDLISKNSIINTLKHIKCGNVFEIQTQLIRKRFDSNSEICLICNPYSPSYKEKDLSDYIKSMGFNVVKYRDKKFEIDAFISELNIGFEFNGLYWHSELFKDKNYHFDKYNYFRNKGIQIISIYEDDWEYKNVIVKSIIKNKLNKTENIIYARKCKILEVTNKESKDFLNSNHMQGWCVSKFRYGLFFENKLVCLLTIGKNRINLGQKSIDGNYEILRFCNALDTSVVGGFSRMLNHFIKEKLPNKIITYADCSISNGNLYKSSGFSMIGFTNPNYFYFSKKENKKINRFSFTKHKLIKMGFDKNKTEKEIMFENDYYRIYDSGSIKYEIIP